MYKDLERLDRDPSLKTLNSVPKEEEYLWKKTWGHSFIKENFFTDTELGWLEDLMYRRHIERRVKKNGTLHFFVDIQKIKKKFFNKLKLVISELENCDWQGNFLITSTPYNLHIDTGVQENFTDSVPGKQIIIPLWVCHTNKNKNIDPECGTAVFKNRFIMYGTNFAKSDEIYDTNVFYTVRDYKNLKTYNKNGSKKTNDWNKEFDEDLYKKYFSHFKKEWLDGFELENIFNWKRGNLIVFDRCQAHCGINFLKNNVTLKAGLSLMTTVSK